MEQKSNKINNNLSKRITRIKNKGFDIPYLFNMLECIQNNDLSIFEKENSVLPVDTNSCLRVLEKKIEEYEEYIRLREMFNSLNSFVSEENSIEKIEEVIDGILKSFYLMKKNYGSFAKFNEVYVSLYELIKYELRIRDESRVLNSLVEFSKDVIEINKLISEDIDRINDDKIKDVKLVSDMNLIASKYVSSETGYFNVEVIKSINHCWDSLANISRTHDHISFIKKTIEADMEKVNDLINPSKNRLFSRKSEKNKSFSELKKRIVSASLAGLLFSGVAVGGTILASLTPKNKIYKTTTLEYVQGEGLKDPVTEYLPKNDREETMTLLIAKIAKHDNFLNTLVTVRTYNLDEIKLKSLEEYVSLDVDAYDLTYADIDFKENIFLIKHGEEYRKLIMASQDWDMYEYNGHDLFWIVMSCVVIISCILLFIPNYGLKEKFKDLLKALSVNKANTKEFLEALNELNNIKKKCLNILKNENNLCDDFDRLYESLKDSGFFDEELLKSTNKLVLSRDDLIKSLRK